MRITATADGRFAVYNSDGDLMTVCNTRKGARRYRRAQLRAPSPAPITRRSVKPHTGAGAVNTRASAKVTQSITNPNPTGSRYQTRRFTPDLTQMPYDLARTTTAKKPTNGQEWRKRSGGRAFAG